MPKSRTVHRLRWALAVTVAAAVVLVGYTGHQALQAKHNLELVAGDFTTLGGQLKSGDQPAARVTLAAAQRHAGHAAANTRGPGWWLTSRIPGVRANIVAVRTVAQVSDRLSRDVLPDVVRATAALAPANLRPVGGQVDLDRVEAATPGVVRADRRLRGLSHTVQDMDANDLAPQIAVPVRRMQRELRSATDLSHRASLAVRLLPPMLGSQGGRHYLLVVQNNAELRSTGGIPGAFATVTANGGKVSIDAHWNAKGLESFSRPVLPLSTQEQSLFGDRLGRYPQDVNLTPSFPRSAQLISAMWRERNRQRVDGVLSVDPVALSYVLGGAGPARLQDGTQLTAGNAVDLLLNRVYAQVGVDQQNAFFGRVAATAFQAVSAGQGQPKAVLDGLAHAVAQRRLLVWSAHPAEQSLIAPTRLGGSLAARGRTTPHVGVFLDDGTGDKLGYYLRYGVHVTAARCQAGRQYLTVAVRLRSAVPADSNGLPDYVAENAVGLERGMLRTSVMVYAPAGGYFRTTTDDGSSDSFERLEHLGRQVARVTVDLAPGRTRSLTYEVVTGRGQVARTSLQVTPGAQSTPVGTVGPAATCGS